MEIIWLILSALVIKNREEPFQWQILEMLLKAKAKRESGEPEFHI